MRDGGYGRSRLRNERSWTRTDAALRMSSFYTTLRSACMVLIALRACRLSEAMRKSAVCGCGVSMSDTCDALSGAINTMPAAKLRSVVTGRATGY